MPAGEGLDSSLMMPTQEGKTALILASLNGQLEVVMVLVDARVGVNVRDIVGEGGS